MLDDLDFSILPQRFDMSEFPVFQSFSCTLNVLRVAFPISLQMFVIRCHSLKENFRGTIVFSIVRFTNRVFTTMVY